MRGLLIILSVFAAAAFPAAAQAQATARPCEPEEKTGPACLLAHKPLATLPSGEVFWHIDRFPTKMAAERAAVANSVVTEAFGSTWLFTLQTKQWRSRGGEQLSVIGPLPVTPAATYAAEYLRSIFEPGTTAPLHVHSGPEAFYAVSGDTCLETPDGVQLGRGPGNSLVIRAGPPMLLMAIGTVPRKGFALVLHDASQPPTTLIDHWHPQGACEKQLFEDRAR